MNENEEFEFRLRAEREAAPAQPKANIADRQVMDMPLAMGITPRSALGLLRGAKDVVDTGAKYAARGYDKLTGSNEEAGVDAMNKAGEADSQRLIGDGDAAKLSRIAGQGLITAPIGGILGQGARLVGAPAKVVNALASNGFSTGVPAAAGARGLAADLAIRSGAGAVAGGATVGAIRPEDAGTGAIIGGVIPGGVKAAEAIAAPIGSALRSGAEGLMASSLKASAKAKRTGEEQTAINTLLDKGINVTRGGVDKLRGMVDDLNTQIADKIGSSDARIDPKKVANALADTKKKFGNDVAPTENLNAIGKIEDDFLNTVGAGEIPVQLAQTVKQGTYRNLRDQYGELGAAGIEARKGLARGLKDEIATAVPGVGGLNAEESKLIAALNVTERRVLQQASNNKLGLSALAHNPTAWALFMADKSPLFKSLLARSMSSMGELASPESVNALAGPAAYRALPRAGQNGLLDTSRR